MKKFVCGLLLAALLCACLPMAALAANEVYFTESRVNLFENGAVQMVLVRNGEAAQGEVSYESSSRAVAVDQNGYVTAVNMGSATITARVKTEKRTYTATAYVKVNKQVDEIVVNEQGLTLTTWDDPAVAELLQPLQPGDPMLDLPVLVLSVGRDQSFRVDCRPREASDRTFKMTTSDDKVARMANNNTVRPVNAGECLLTAYSVSNPDVSKTYRVLVLKPVTGVNVSADSKVLFVGGQLQVNASVNPADASVTSVIWSSDTPDIATVDENGVVTGLKRGQATIRATAADGSKRYNRITLNVQQRPESVTLDQYELTVAVGSGKTLRGTVLPNNASDKGMVWSSSDERIARVNNNGYVSAVSRGTCVITCASKADPSVFAEAYVNVIQPVTRIAFTERTVSVNVNQAVAINWTTEPANASDSSVTLTSSDPRIATVDQNGYVYGVKRGETTIIAKANDGSGKTARITVQVMQPVMGVHMKNDTVSVGVHESGTIQAVLEPSDASDYRMNWYSADTRIATISGSNNKPRVTGQAWGTTTVYGTTVDGGYTTSCTVRVGNYDKALAITDLYLLNNAVKMSVRNESNMNVTYFTFTVELYDWQGKPIACNYNGSNVINGSHGYTLFEGESTQHGRFSFGDFVQPETQIARLVMRITGYRTDDGYRRSIAADRQPTMVYESPVYVGPAGGITVPTGAPVQPTQQPTQKPTQKPSQPAVQPSGNAFDAVKPVKLNVEDDNKVRLTLHSYWQQTFHRVNFEIELYDANDNPIICGTYKDKPTNIIHGYNAHELAPGQETKRGTFNFTDFVQPSTRIEYAIVRVVSYVLKSGERVIIPLEEQPLLEYRGPNYHGAGHIPEHHKTLKK